MMKSLQDRDNRAILSQATIRRCVDLFNGNEFCYLCRSLLKNKVFENGLDLCVGSSTDCKAKTDLRSRRLLEDHWLPFAKSAMDIILAIGLCPVRFIRSDDLKGVAIPYVPIIGTYDIHIITTKEGLRSYELFDTDSGMEPVADAMVLDGYNFDPMMDGQLTSLVAVLEPLFRFTAEMSDAAVTCEKIRSNPPIVIQKKDATNGGQENEAAVFDYYADTDNIKSTTNNQFQRDEAQIKRLDNQRRMFMNALYPTQAQTNAKNALDNMVPLPSNFQIGTLLEPSGRTDFVSLNRMCQETICSVLGVPRSLFISDNVVKSDSEGTHETLKQTLIFWKDVVSRTLTKLWRVCNEERLLEKVMKDAKKSKRALQGIALESHLAKKMPRIEIPITPYTDSSQLRMLYLQEIISWETYATYLLRNSSLPPQILNTKKDPWSHADKKELLGIKPEPVGPAKPVSAGMDGGGSSGATDEHGTKAKNSSRVAAGSKTVKT